MIYQEGVHMWKSKILKQAGICVIVVLTFAAAQAVNVPQLNRGSETVVAYLSKNYTAEDVAAFAKRSVKAAVKAPASVTNAILSANGQREYGEPVDEKIREGETVSVYAVEAGTVSAVGENDKIGKFLKITHGDEAESVYGNCTKIHVKELERVKKGQVIASFKKEGNAELYYALKELK